jgi:hypothetical protein
MSGVIDTLKKISTVPVPASSSEFEAWIEQAETVHFLDQNTRETELVVFACLNHILLQAVLVPSDQLDPPNMDDLQKWDLISDGWGINYHLSGEDPTVWITRPLESAGSKALIRGEKLVFSRSFEGHDDKKSYIEFLQKFVLIFDLHFVSHKNAYCRLDEHGDLEEVIRITEIPAVKGGWNGRVVTVDRRLLDDYMLLTSSALVRLFDFTLFDPSNFSGWGDGRKERSVTNEEYGYRITVQAGVGSYMRGVQIVRSSETMEKLHNRLTKHYEEKQYASFIAHDWKNKRLSEISCGPGHTANYFTKSHLPFEITPAFFRPEILLKYKADPQKYKLDERSIDCRGSWHLQTYDINEAGQVHTYLIYLRNLPYEEQLYWRSFNEPPKASISKRAMATDMRGESYKEYNPLQNIKATVRKLAEKEVPWWNLRGPDLLDQVHYPVTPSSEEWADEIMALDKLLVEGFEEKWLRNKAFELGLRPLPSDASLVLVAKCLQGLGFEEEHARRTVSSLRTLHHLRTKLKGHAGGSEAEGIRKSELAMHGSFKIHFKTLCGECDEAIQRIIEALGQE